MTNVQVPLVLSFSNINIKHFFFTTHLYKKLFHFGLLISKDNLKKKITITFVQLVHRIIPSIFRTKYLDLCQSKCTYYSKILLVLCINHCIFRYDYRSLPTTQIPKSTSRPPWHFIKFFCPGNL